MSGRSDARRSDRDEAATRRLRRPGARPAHRRDAPRPAPARRARRRRPDVHPAVGARHARTTTAPLPIGELAAPRERQAAVDDAHRRLPRASSELVTRRPAPADGRQVVVELTAAAVQVLDADRHRRDAWLASHVLDELDDAERDAAARRRPAARSARRSSMSGRVRRWSTASATTHLRRPQQFRNYRLFAGGSFLSNVGTWLQRVAQDWLVLALTGSAGALGITTGLQFLPIAAVLAVRRRDRRPLLEAQRAQWTQVDHGRHRARARRARRDRLGRRPWHVYVLTFLFGTGGAFDVAGPPGVRQRDGRTPSTCPTPSASTRRRSTSPA